MDEGPVDGPVMLLLHGMPTWSYLYRDMIPLLVDAGFRCIAPDHMGFGRSDKPTDPNWYSIARHQEILSSLILALDLQRVTSFARIGVGIGLAQAVMMPERFERLVIMNTWLHHEGYEYSDGIRNWHSNWHEGAVFIVSALMWVCYFCSMRVLLGSMWFSRPDGGPRSRLNRASSDNV